MTKATAASAPNIVLCELEETGVAELPSYSPFCSKVRMALAVADVPFSSRRRSRPDAFKRINRAGQVPVLIVDDAVIADSTAILTRIELMAPGAFDRDLDARAKAEAWLWEEMADTVLNGFLVAARWVDDANWPRVRDAYFKSAPWIVRALIAPTVRQRVVGTLNARDVLRHGHEVMGKRFEETLARMEARAPLAGFWVSDSLSRADFAIAAQLNGIRTALTPGQRSQIEARTKLRAYLDRVATATTPRSAN